MTHDDVHVRREAVLVREEVALAERREAVTRAEIVHWGTDGIAGVACGAGARWPSAFLISNRDRDKVTCLSCQCTTAYRKKE